MESESKDHENNNEKTVDSNVVSNESIHSFDNIEQIGTASLYTYILVTCICVGGFLFGYDTGGKYIFFLFTVYILKHIYLYSV